MKRTVFLLLTTLMVNIHAQVIDVLYFGIDCPSNNIESFYGFSEPDTIGVYALWIEQYNGSWDSLNGSYQVFSVPAGYYSFISPTPVIDNQYRLVYKDLGSAYTSSLDTIVTVCGNYLGINQYEYSAVVTMEYFTISGQRVLAFDKPGMYLQVTTYKDHRQTFKTIYH